MKNKANKEDTILFIGVVALIFLTFLLGFCMGLRCNSDNTSQEQTQNIEDVKNAENGKRKPYGLEYQDAETGVCYFVIKNDTENIQAMSPRYNPDGSIMVKEVK